MIGKTISHYKILEKLGEGGMGVVYKAEDTKLGREVALKFLPVALTQESDARERLAREAQAAAALNHPNICTIHEIDEVDGQTFIAMEHIEGETLRTRIRSAPLDIGETLDIAAQVAEGLAEAHAKGIVHRDIKPANIMITAAGRVKIMDFGLARTAGCEQLTKTGATTGTIAYMSPEQSRGKDVDHRTDIWSFGVMLYEMVVGQRPFSGEHEQTVVYSITNEDPEPMTALRTGVPMELERIVGKCMYKDPGERYQTVADLLADLHRFEREAAQETRTGRTTVLRPPAGRRIRRRAWVATLVAVVAIAAWIVAQRIAPPETQPVPDRKMLVVLPFENLGAPEDEYFADGITEEITARLAGIRELGIIARTSAVKYKNTDKTIRQIGEELGVDYALEGTIRWQRVSETENQVRVTPQLIRVADASHIWADIYQEDMADIFRVQSNIAEQVAGALDIELLEPERRSLEARPTESLEAHQAYLRGKEREQLGYGKEDLRLMEEMFRRATELDPRFALAYAELSMTHSASYHFKHDRSAERLAEAKAAADRALELEPQLPEGHLALGWYYYWGFRDYAQALAALKAVEKARPNDTRMLFAVGAIHKRQGQFDEAIEVTTRAAELDPLDARLALEIGISHRFLRRYAEAEHQYDRVISLAPDRVDGYLHKAILCRTWLGDLEGARATLEKMPPTRDDNWVSVWYDQEFYERNFQAALGWYAQLSTKPGEGLVTSAFLHRLAGQEERALARYDSARALLEIEATDHPDDPDVHSALAEAYSGLGRKAEAIREIQLATELLPLSRDVVDGLVAIENLAAVYAEVGEYDAAIEQLEYLLSMPSSISVPLLRLNPRWDPLREHPGFKRLLEEYSKSGT